MAAPVKPRSVLEARLGGSRADIARARAVLEAPRIAGPYQSIIWNRFNPRFHDLEERLTTVDQELLGGTDPATLWTNLNLINADAKHLLRECLAFVEGVLVRTTRLDDRLCDIADALLNDLSRRSRVAWSELTILAEEESIVQIADIIRLRFPEFEVWALPVVAHEFGHLVARRLTWDDGQGGSERHPVAELLGKQGARERQAHELFADFFGVLAMGPAFACTAILLRFDPISQDPAGPPAAGQLPTHPEAARRAAFVLAALRALDEQAGDFNRPYRQVISRLDGAWTGTVQMLNQPSQVPALEANRDLRLLRQFFKVAEAHLLDVSYSGWSRAGELVPAFGSAQPAAAAVAAVDGCSVIDVLNAAWRVRLDNWASRTFQLSSLESRALELCKAAAGIPAAGPED